MKGFIRGAAAGLLLAGCNVTVNNESMENQAEAIGERLENAAGGLENAAEDAGAGIERAADAVGNRAEGLGNVDLDVDLRSDGNAAEANAH